MLLPFNVRILRSYEYRTLRSFARAGKGVWKETCLRSLGKGGPLTDFPR